MKLVDIEMSEKQRNLYLKSGLDSFKKLIVNSVQSMTREYKAVFPEIQIISKTDDKIYVDNLKIMTAQNLYDNKTGVMLKLNDKLSKELSIEEPPINWWASEKWDGIRALWDGEKMISRGSGLGKPKVYTYIPDWFKKILPPGIALDGEIWIGRGMFQKTSRLSTIKPGRSYDLEQIDDIWSGKENSPVIFKIFDTPNSKEPFEQRMEYIKDVIKCRKNVWEGISYSGKKIYPLQLTEQIKIESMSQLVKLYTELTKAGAEGIMLRAPNSPYELRRSKYMLKYKIKEDAECIVKEYVLGEGRLTGLLGSLKCEIIKNKKNSGIITNIGTGFTDEQRENYCNEKSPDYIPIGSIISFSYMEMTADGIPRHPVFRGIRDDIKKPTMTVKEVRYILKQDKYDILKDKPENWQFKLKFYNQAIGILNDEDTVYTTEEYIKELRKGGMNLKDEEEYKNKNGRWKSSIIQKIDKILNTGVSVKIKDKKLDAIENLTAIAGIGEANAIRLYEEYNVHTLDQLIELHTKNHKILNSAQVIGLTHHEDLNKRIDRYEMDIWKEIMVENMEQTVSELGITDYKLDLSGSYRRGKKDSGDVDILITTDYYRKEFLYNYCNTLIKNNIFLTENIISKGISKIMCAAKIDEYYRHVDIFYCSKEIYPFSLLFTTGSKEFNVRMRAHANRNGFSLNEKKITFINNKEIPEERIFEKIGKTKIETENDIFDFLDYKYVLPEKR